MMRLDADFQSFQLTWLPLRILSDDALRPQATDKFSPNCFPLIMVEHRMDISIPLIVEHCRDAAEGNGRELDDTRDKLDASRIFFELERWCCFLIGLVYVCSPLTILLTSLVRKSYFQLKIDDLNPAVTYSKHSITTSSLLCLPCGALSLFPLIDQLQHVSAASSSQHFGSRPK